MKKIKTFIIAMSIILISGTISASASQYAQLMSYNGTGIWSKSSNSTFSLGNSNNTIYTYHTTVSVTGGSESKLHVKVMKKNWLGSYSTEKADHIASGKGSWTWTDTVGSGDYRLRFERDDYSSGTFNISGYVIGPTY